MSKEKKAYKNLSLEELKVKGVELEAQLFKLRMQKATGQLANTGLIRSTRKDLARVRTFQAQGLKGSAQKVARGK